MKISVSYLTSKDLENDLRKLNVTNADYIHVDVMDGKFVKNKSLPFKVIKNIHKYTNKRLDVHLMVKKPLKFISDYATLNTEFITVHVENKYVDKSLDLIEAYGIKTGISLKPNTPLDVLDSYLDRVDLILIMSVEPGRGGQEFIEDTIDRVKEVRKKLNEAKSKALISVDGGINEEVAEKLKDADILVSGNYILSSDDFQYQIYKLRK